MSAHACVLSIEPLSRSEKIWSDLFTVDRDPSPFVSYEWFSALTENLLGYDPEIIVFRSDGTAVGLMPAAISDGTLEFIGDERVTDLNGMICTPGYAKIIAATLANFVGQHDLKINLFPLAADNGLVVHLKDALPDVLIEERDACPVLDLAQTYDDYLEGLDSKSRHELRRKMRKINGTVMQDVQSSGLEILFGLMSASDIEKGKFLTPGIMAFFRDLADNFSRIGWLRMRALFLDSRPIGMILAFSLKERVYLYNMGYDPEYRSISPGIMTIALDIQSAISEGYKYYDFLRGGEDYKYRFGAKERYTVRIVR
jgi:CelD/BcsL family acetyltransferase involved in cellulose biosynthesis